MELIGKIKETIRWKDIKTMPVIGEVKRGQEIGKQYGRKYQWHPCIKCGITRWVIFAKGYPLNLKCQNCGTQGQLAELGIETRFQKGISHEVVSQETRRKMSIAHMKPTHPNIKRTAKDTYIWISCPQCGENRWIPQSRVAKAKLCLRCSSTRKRGHLERIKSTAGYISVYRPNHPCATSQGYVKEHRFLTEQHIGRILTATEIVHHINKIRDDNHIENLMLFPCRGAHISHHKYMRENITCQNSAV